MAVLHIFYSHREAYCWLGTLIVLTSVYATIGLARSYPELITQEMQNFGFGVGFVLTLLAILLSCLWVGLRRGQTWRLVGLLAGVLAVYTLLVVRVSSLEERTHLLEYSVISLLVYQALGERARAGGQASWLALRAFVLVMLFSLVDEVVQYFLPGRVFDPRDMMFNMLASLLALASLCGADWLGRNASET